MATDEIRTNLLIGRDTLSPALVKAGKDASDVSSQVRELTRNLYELGKQRATPVVDLDDKNATTRLATVLATLKDLNDKTANPKIDVNDKSALAAVGGMRVQLDRLSHQVASPRITLEGVARAEAQLLRLDAQLGRMTTKRGLLGRVAGGLISGIGGLFGGGGQRLALSTGGGAASAGAGAGAQAGGGFLQSLGPYGQFAAYGIGATLAALLAPAALPLGLGALAGAGGAYGSLALGKQAQAQLTALQASLKGATGKQRELIRDQITALRQSQGGQLGVYQAFQGLGQSALGVFSGALEARGPARLATTFFGRGGPVGATFGRAPSFLTSMRDILEQIGRFVKAIGPSLGGMFRAAVPYIQLFVKFGEEAAKTLLPVFTAMLKQFAPYLPQIAKGLLNIVKGVAGFLKAIGPQAMQASAKIFVLATKAMEEILIGLGKAINWLVEHMPVWAHNIAAWWDRIRHFFAAAGDAIMHYWDTWRHNWAHIWDVIYSDTVGNVIRMGHGIETAFNDTKRFMEIWIARLEVMFGGWAEHILHYFQDAFQFLPGIIPGVNALKAGLARSLTDLGHWVTSAQATVHRLTGKTYTIGFGVSLPSGVVPGRTVGVSGKAAYAAGTSGAASGWAWVGERGPELVHMRGGETVIPNHAIGGYASGTGMVTVHLSLPSMRTMAALFGAIVGRIVRSVQSRYTALMPAGVGGGLGRAGLRGLENLWMSAGGPGGGIAHIAAAIALAESGGNPNAYNPSGASGLWQILGQVVPGNIFNPYVNALNAVTKYRDAGGFSPWVTYETGAYLQYMDRGGWVRPGWNLIHNGTGHPEQVIPHGGSGTTVINHVTVQVGHGTHPVAAAQEIIKLLNTGAKSGVKLRTSILGPG